MTRFLYFIYRLASRERIGILGFYRGSLLYYVSILYGAFKVPVEVLALRDGA